jgi:hypothetical protein
LPLLVLLLKTAGIDSIMLAKASQRKFRYWFIVFADYFGKKSITIDRYRVAFFLLALLSTLLALILLFANIKRVFTWSPSVR